MKTKLKKTCSSLFVFAILAFPFVINAQVTFQKIYPSNKTQSGRDVVATDDGGYLIAGLVIGTNDSDIYIVKTNSVGNILWTKTYGGVKADYPYCMIKTSDSAYFVVGYTKSFGGGKSNTYLLKLNKQGDTLWTKTYGGSQFDEGHQINPTFDGNYIISGSSNNQNPSDYNAYLMKITPAGAVIWIKYYGGPLFETANSVKQSLDGGYIFTGQTYSYGAGQGDVWLVKTNATGDTAWTKTFGGPLFEEGNSVLANSNGSYIVCAETNSFGAGDIDVYVVETDAYGNKIWDKTYGGSKKEVSHMIQPILGGGYIIAAITRSFGLITPRMWLLKIDSVGDTLWTCHYGGSGHTHCYSAKPTLDGGYMAVGHDDSYSPNTEIMFVKLNPTGGLGPYSSIEEISSEYTAGVYPNPTDGQVKINFTQTYPPSEITIHNLLGQAIYSEKNNVSNTIKTIDLTGKEPGVYVLCIKSDNKFITKRIVLK